MLDRDLDFLIAPINATKIEEVNGGPFVLGMDRSAQLVRERRALYAAFGAVDMEPMRDEIRADAVGRLKASGARFDAITDYARPLAAATAARVFGIGAADDPLFAEAVRAIFAHTFLNLNDDEAVRQRAIIAGKLMQEWFDKELDRRIAANESGEDFMGQLLRQGALDKEGIRRTLGGMLVGSIDTTVTSFAKIICVAEKDPSLRTAMGPGRGTKADIYGLCQEALRRWPHNPILLRQAASDTTLNGTKVKAGDSVIAWTEAAMHDPDAFPEPARMKPDRSPSCYLHFGAGLHPCAGRALNRIQIPILVECLLDTGARRAGKLRYAGPFPDIMPMRRPQEDPT